MALKNGSEKGEKTARQNFSCPRCGFMINPDPEMHQHQRSDSTQAETGAGIFEEKRRHQRLELRTMVEVDGEKALLFNISRSGLLLSTPFYPKGPNVDVILDNDEQHFILYGAIRWVSKRRSFSNLVDFGVEILQAPPEYIEFVERIQSQL